MNHPEATVAILHISGSSDAEKNTQAWQNLKRVYLKVALPPLPKELQTECDLLIPLPNGMRVLCQLLDAAHAGSMQSEVSFYGQPILHYSSESPFEIDV